VLAWRTGRSHLAAPSGDGPVEVARRLRGVQAQVMSSAELALSVRTKGTRPADVQDALWRDRSLVKTWTARGTLHLVPSDELALWCAAMQARGAYWAKPAWERYHGVSADDMERILGGLDEALQGRCLTRRELAERLGQVTGHHELASRIMGSWGAAIKPAAYQAKLCFGPNRGRNVTFVAPKEWIGSWHDVDGDTALGTLVRGYLDTYGPSTRDDFARWLGVEGKVARRAFALVQHELVAVDVEGSPAWLTPEGAASVVRARARGIVHLLPAFDPYVVGVLAHLGRLLPDPSLRPRVSRPAGWISPTVVVDGRIVGVWHHQRRARGIEISLEPFEPLPAAVQESVERRVRSTATLLARTGDADDLPEA
jgi:hypothetical protein